MIGNPLEHGIAEQQIGALGGNPGGEIGLDEFAFRQPLARLLEHGGRGIEPDHLGVRKARQQKLGGVSGSAAHVDHARGVRERHLREEIARRARALVLELEVLIGAPVRHRSNSSEE